MVEPVSASHGLTSSVIVACVAYGVPPPTVTWRYGTSLSGGVHRTQHELIHGIPVITSSLELCPTRETAINGVYSCEVENGVTDSKIKSTPVHICFIGQSVSYRVFTCDITIYILLQEVLVLLCHQVTGT